MHNRIHVRLTISILALLVLAGGVSVLRAQRLLSPDSTQAAPGGGRVLLDGVAAVAGNEVILMSDVMQRSTILAQQQQGLDPRNADVQREALNGLIDEKILLTKAQEDSIVVSDAEVNQAVDRRMEQIISQVGSQAKVEQTYGMPISAIRAEAHNVIRQQLLAQRVMQKHFTDLKLTERDIQEFYNAYKDSLPMVPEQVELQRLVLIAKPSPEAKKATELLARSIIDSIKAGGSFADFAKRYSADPGSAPNGGELGFVAPGRFVHEYEAAAKKLGINEISDPVQSPYGIHIIQVLDRHGDTVRSRHILLPMQQTTSERDSLIARLNQIRSQIQGGADFATLVRQYSQEEETRSSGGVIGKFTPATIPVEEKTLLVNLKDGEVSQPAPVTITPTETGYQIVRISRRIPSHKVDVQEDRAQLERLAEVYKQNTEYAKWLAELRTEIYWEVKGQR